MKRFNLNPLVLFMVLAAMVLAGTTNLDSLTLSDDLVVGDQATITGALAADDLNATDDVTAGDDVVASGLVSSAEKLRVDYGGTGTEALVEFSGPAGNASATITAASNSYVLKLAGSPALASSVSALTVSSSTVTIPGIAAIAGKTTVGGVFSLVTSAAETVASATTVAPTKGLVYLTGATAITGATIGPYTAGTISIWCNVGGDATGPVVTDGNNLVMAGNLTLGPNDCLVWVSDGTNLIEISRSVN